MLNKIIQIKKKEDNIEILNVIFKKFVLKVSTIFFHFFLIFFIFV